MAKKGVTLTNGTNADELYPKTRIEMVVDSKDASIASQLVLSTEQTLDVPKRSQARKNIGAIGLQTPNSLGGVLEFEGNKVLPETDTAYITHDDQKLNTFLGELRQDVLSMQQDVNRFFKDEAGVENVIDTLKEIQDYISDDKSGATELIDKVDEVESNVSKVSGDLTALSGKAVVIGTTINENNSVYNINNNSKKINPTTIASAVTMSTANNALTVLQEINNINGTLTDLENKKQPTLSSGTNIKTIGGESVLGSGNIALKTINNTSIVGSGNIAFKTINNASIVGSGDITISQDPTTVFFKNVITFD